ncbi:uncharacterized protein BJ171DRAFT_102883 [Polychytrium aggregatum]|uniref:uncharacterized protein n=1 Tax=Polychytrium aggregatum TaxID=110093 RepID=UPI0022FE091F|nr:uncharacterized protein BJ171DRAFT_102883 [Polychytrium aggregatum]KAI9190518.1 hypothetical protein BJ171DRAFT_102883 [Polychytrium aggregatum]
MLRFLMIRRSTKISQSVLPNNLLLTIVAAILAINTIITLLLDILSILSPVNVATSADGLSVYTLCMAADPSINSIVSGLQIGFNSGVFLVSAVYAVELRNSICYSYEVKWIMASSSLVTMIYLLFAVFTNVFVSAGMRLAFHFLLGIALVPLVVPVYMTVTFGHDSTGAIAEIRKNMSKGASTATQSSRVTNMEIGSAVKSRTDSAITTTLFSTVRLSRHSRDLESGKSDVGIFDLHVVDRRIFIFSPSRAGARDTAAIASYVFEIPFATVTLGLLIGDQYDENDTMAPLRSHKPDELLTISDAKVTYKVEIVHSRELQGK